MRTRPLPGALGPAGPGGDLGHVAGLELEVEGGRAGELRRPHAVAGDPAHGLLGARADQPARLGPGAGCRALKRVIDSFVVTCTASGANGCVSSQVTESPETNAIGTP